MNSNCMGIPLVVSEINGDYGQKLITFSKSVYLTQPWLQNSPWNFILAVAFTILVSCLFDG